MASQAKLQKQSKPKRGRPPASNAKETRLKLLRSAAREFSRAEYSQVSLVAIARNVGLTSTAIYNHFQSKDDLFLATAKHLMTVNLEGIGKAMASEGDWQTKLRSILHQIKENETGWFRFPLLTPAVQLKSLRDPESFSDILRLREGFVQHFTTLVKSAQEAGDIPKHIPPHPTGELLLAFTFNGLGAAMGHRSTEEEVSHLVESFLALLRITA